MHSPFTIFVFSCIYRNIAAGTTEMKGLCCIFNYAPHYRLPIYRRMSEEMGAEFYFGANLPGKERIRKFDLNALPGFRGEMKVHVCGPFRWSSGWLRIAFSRKYDRFIITQDLYAVNQWLFAFACSLLHKKIYVWSHGLKSADPEKQGSRTTRLLRVWYDRFVAGYFLYGDRAKENMYLAGYDLDRLHPVYNSLDYSESLALRGTVPENPYTGHFGNGLPVLLFIGRLTGVKRLDMIVKVHEALYDRGVKTNVVFIGDGPEKEMLAGMTRADLRQNFWYTGAVYDGKEIHKYLYHATLCLSPGNVGLTAINCLSHGLPVITNDDFDSQMPEYEAITPGMTGDFFRDGDIDDFTARTAEWLSRLASVEYRERTREECYKVIDERYNPDYQIKVFRTVLSDAPAGSA